MNATHPITPWVQGFFHQYLAAQRGLSLNTILSYRDSLKLFLRFVSERVGKPVDQLSVEDFDRKLTAAFLDHLEASRGNSTRTRNQRLAALRAFFRYVAGKTHCCRHAVSRFVRFLPSAPSTRPWSTWRIKR